MSVSHNMFAEAPRASATLLDARLQLLDRQLHDDAGEPVGIVDDLDVDGIAIGADIDPGAPAPRVVGILTAQVLAVRIFGGRAPRARLQPLPWRLVAKVGTVVQLRPTVHRLEGLWLEHWLRDHLIGKIPGGRHAAQ